MTDDSVRFAPLPFHLTETFVSREPVRLSLSHMTMFGAEAFFHNGRIHICYKLTHP